MNTPIPVIVNTHYAGTAHLRAIEGVSGRLKAVSDGRLIGGPNTDPRNRQKPATEVIRHNREQIQQARVLPCRGLAVS